MRRKGKSELMQKIKKKKIGQGDKQVNSTQKNRKWGRGKE